MVTVTFISSSGDRTVAQAAEGDILLRLGQAAGMPLEGTCEGQMACSTCHVIVARDWFGKLPPATEDEEDLLDLAADVRPASRLSCQIELTAALDGLEVHIPGDSHDMRRR